MREIDYLGHVVSSAGVSLSDSRKQGVSKLRAPTTTAKLRSFLGLANYFRTFVKGFATRAKPLTTLFSEGSIPLRGGAEESVFRAQDF